MSKYKHVVNLGSKQLESRHFIRKIAWPVYAWKAVIPNYYDEDLDILERLVLSLSEINRLMDGRVVHELGISKELITAVRLSCVEKQYLDKEFKITKSGKLALKNLLSFEQSILTNYKQIYIFRDALTGDIVPNFSVTTLPSDKSVLCDYVFERLNQQDKIPIFNEISYAFKIRKNLNRIITTIQNDYSIQKVEADQLSDLEFIDFSDEVYWEDVTESGEVKTLAEAEEEQEQVEKELQENKNISFKIVSPKAELIWLEAEIYLDPDLPERLVVNSPFGESEDEWFIKHLQLFSRQDSRIDEMISAFLEEAKETLMDRYPFNNILHIELFVKHPHIANYEKWKPIREAVEAMTRAYNRLNEGHEDYDNFYARSQRLLEVILSLVIQQLPNKNVVLSKISNISFRHTCERIAEDLRINIPTNLMGPSFFPRLREVAQGRGVSSKDRALFLAFDAYKHKEETPSLQILRNIPDFYEKINHICKVRNVTTHYSEEDREVTKNYKQIKQDVDFLVDQLVIHYLKVGK